jgi:hypothetical protein
MRLSFLVSLGGASLTLQAKTATQRPDGLYTFAPERVSRITRADSLVNGTLIGLGAGFIASGVFLSGACGGNDPEYAAAAFPIGLGTFVPAGAVIGALIDKAIKRTFYVSPSRAKISMSARPLIGRNTRGVALQIRF